MSRHRVTVIIPTWNTRHWLDGCLTGLREQTYQEFEILMVDNGSSDGSVDHVRQEYPEVKTVVFDQNRGFAPAVNAGIKQSNTEYIALLNVDTIPQPDWLANLVATLDQSPSEVGHVASKMLSMDNPAIMDDAGNSFSWYGSACKEGRGELAIRYSEQREIFSACAGAALYRRSFFQTVGYFDETFSSYLEDIDLGFRGQLQGFRCLFVPEAKVLHKWHGAELSRQRYVYLNTCNRLAVLLKNIPWQLLFKHAYTLLYGQIYFFLVYKKPLASLQGYVSFLLALPQLLRQRRSIMQHKKISDQAVEALLTNSLNEPSLQTIVKSRFAWR